MSASSQATRPGDKVMGRGAEPARCRRHQVVRERLPTIGRTAFQEISLWEGVVCIQVPFCEPSWAVTPNDFAENLKRTLRELSAKTSLIAMIR